MVVKCTFLFNSKTTKYLNQLENKSYFFEN